MMMMMMMMMMYTGNDTTASLATEPAAAITMRRIDATADAMRGNRRVGRCVMDIGDVLCCSAKYWLLRLRLSIARRPSD